MTAIKTGTFISILIIVLCITPAFGSTQTKHWIYLKDYTKDKPIQLSAKSYQRRDLRNASPDRSKLDCYPQERYVSQLRQTGLTINYVSRWLNAVSVTGDSTQLEEALGLPFVERVSPVAGFKGKRLYHSPKFLIDTPFLNDSLNYGLSYNQLHLSQIDSVHDLGYTGESIVIGIMDTGFDLDHPFLNTIKNQGRLSATYDFINHDPDVQDIEDIQQYHGTSAWSVIAGYAPGLLIGSAYGANYVLAKTELQNEEIQQEEDNWIAAAEWMDSLGVDIICSALGYIDWYDTTQLDGHTCAITIAAEAAASSGIVVVNAAGNERNNYAWGTIIPPSDGDSVIAVGAVNRNGNLADFSSPGPTFDGRIKPDIMAQGVQVFAADYSNDGGGYDDGTSVAAPIVAGGLALALEAHPHWSLDKLFSSLRLTGSRSGTPDSNYGWGIAKIFDLIAVDGYFIVNQTETNPVYSDTILLDISLFDSLGRSGGNHQIDIQVIDGSAELIFPRDIGINFIRQFVYFPLPGLQKILISDSIAGMVKLIKIDVGSDRNITLEVWPNPAIDTVVFVFGLDSPSWAELSVFTVSGDKVVSYYLNSTIRCNTLTWPAQNANGDNIASGVYIASLKTPYGQKIAKFAYIKK
jgi:subtilisin family serine protease